MRTAFCAVLIALMGAPSSAFAADSKAAEEARRHFQRSKELYDDGDLAGSLNELERSYAAVPNFKLNFNIGQIQAQLQNHAAALKSFQKFLSEGGAEVTEPRRGSVVREIEKLRTRVAELTITVNLPGAEISVDDVVVGKSPLSGPVTVNGGKRKVTATLQNHFPVVKQLDVVGLDQVSVKLELQTVVGRSASLAGGETGSPTATSLAGRSGRLPLWVPWAGTGALAVSAGVLGILTLTASAAQRALIARYPITEQEQANAATTTRTRALATDILIGVTAAAAVGSVIYTLLREPDEVSTSFDVRVGLSSNGIFALGHF